jgi:FkbM family methyltransferase
MKKVIYNLINQLGYRIEKKITDKKILASYLLKFNSQNFDLLYDSRYYISSLMNKFDDFNLIDNGEGFLVSFENFIFYVESNEEFFILNEIYVNEDYHFVTSQKTVVIDIGANVGLASIYYSQFDFVEKIYAFEPVPKTYKQAMKNFELNNLVDKISILNIGLGEENKKMAYLYDPKSKGSAGLSAIKSERYIGNINAVEVDVEIRNSYDEISRIIEKNPDYQIAVKMDCEGAETEILKSMLSHNLIANINFFIIEWHHESYSRVLNLLLENGYSCFTKSATLTAGLILAFKNKHV